MKGLHFKHRESRGAEKSTENTTVETKTNNSESIDSAQEAQQIENSAKVLTELMAFGMSKAICGLYHSMVGFATQNASQAKSFADENTEEVVDEAVDETIVAEVVTPEVDISESIKKDAAPRVAKDADVQVVNDSVTQQSMAEAMKAQAASQPQAEPQQQAEPQPAAASQPQPEVVSQPQAEVQSEPKQGGLFSNLVVDPDNGFIGKQNDGAEEVEGLKIANCDFGAFMRRPKEGPIKTTPMFQAGDRSMLFGNMQYDPKNERVYVTNNVSDYYTAPFKTSPVFQATNIPTGYDPFRKPVHKIDEPVKPQQPPVIKPKDQDNVNVDLDAINDIPVVDTKKRELPNIINPGKIVDGSDEDIKKKEDHGPFIPLYTEKNNKIAQEFKNAQATLLRIQAIANELHAQCMFEYYHSEPYNKVILVYISPEGGTRENSQGELEVEFDYVRSFIIDPGVIIDRRVKLFPTFYDAESGKWPILETCNPYDLRPNRENSKEGSFNEDLIRGIILYGHNNVNPKRGMMSDELIKLNKYVELSSMPTKFANSAIRNQIRARLFEFMEDGKFDLIYAQAPWSRWRFAVGSCDTDTCSFVLTNRGTPWCFGGIVVMNPVIEIYFDANGGRRYAINKAINTLMPAEYVSQSPKVEKTLTNIIRDPNAPNPRPMPDPAKYEKRQYKKPNNNNSQEPKQQSVPEAAKKPVKNVQLSMPKQDVKKPADKPAEDKPANNSDEEKPEVPFKIKP